MQTQESFIKDLVKEFNRDGIRYEYRDIFGKTSKKNATYIVGFLSKGEELEFILEASAGCMLGTFRKDGRLYNRTISLHDGGVMTDEEYADMVEFCNNLDDMNITFDEL